MIKRFNDLMQGKYAVLNTSLVPKDQSILCILWYKYIYTYARGQNSLRTFNWPPERKISNNIYYCAILHFKSKTCAASPEMVYTLYRIICTILQMTRMKPKQSSKQALPNDKRYHMYSRSHTCLLTTYKQKYRPAWEKESTFKGIMQRR